MWILWMLPQGIALILTFRGPFGSFLISDHKAFSAFSILCKMLSHLKGKVNVLWSVCSRKNALHSTDCPTWYFQIKRKQINIGSNKNRISLCFTGLPW